MSYLQDRKKKNIDFLKKQIEQKNSSNPYYVNESIYSVRNEYDEFPYPYWYKGIAKSDTPIVADREAGWIPKRVKTEVKRDEPEPKADSCFQAPCSTVYPCYAQDNNYLYLNKACVNLLHQ